MDTPETFIFFGKPGAGKGTQARLLVDFLKQQGKNILYIETGGKFREFLQSGTFMAERMKQCMNSGELLPEFIPIWAWTSVFIEQFTGKESFVLDGLARRPLESETLDGALKFMGIEKRTVIFISVSPEWSTERLMGRGREDDTPESVKVRLEAYERNNAPSIDFFRDNPDYRFIEINGEQPIEGVHQDIKEALGF